MREMKFRAWSLSKKKMLDRVLAGPGDPCSIVWDEDREEWLNFDNACGVILQFTGLKDRLGKEIYEGDVLKSYEGILWKVQWDNEKAEFELAWCGGPQPVYYRAGMYLVKDTHCEVIGNVYEQTELLKVNHE